MTRRTIVRRSTALGAIALVLGLAATGCGSSSPKSSPAGPGGGRILKVPSQYKTIQKAVDAAKPKDLVLVSPGVYKEAVTVETDNIVIRGLDRNKTVLEGSFKLQNGIRVVGAKGVAVENMTAQDYTANGFFWTGVTGYRGSYLNAIRNGDYGIYAFESTDGLLDHSYAAGSPDAGFYIGGCYTCDAVIDHVVSEWNGLGYSGTNSGGNLYIVNSVFRENRVGVVPNVGTYEPCFPERETTIAGNQVYSNNNGKTDAISVAELGFGNGILLPGGIDNVVVNNRVWDHDITGIGLVPMPEDNPHAVPSKSLTKCELKPPAAVLDVAKDKLPSTLLWPVEGNKIQGNVVSGSRLADLGLATLGTTPTPSGDNCFSGNQAATTAPLNLQQIAPCGAAAAATGFDQSELEVLQIIARPKPAPVPYAKVKLPDRGPQENMPNAATAPARPQDGPPAYPDVNAIAVPPQTGS